MLGNDDFERIREDLTAVREDRPVRIAIRRGNASLPAQSVRITQAGGGQRVRGEGIVAAQGATLVFGAPAFDVQPDDRFTLNGIVYKVVYVRPNRELSTVAEAEVSQ